MSTGEPPIYTGLVASYPVSRAAHREAAAVFSRMNRQAFAAIAAAGKDQQVSTPEPVVWFDEAARMRFTEGIASIVRLVDDFAGAMRRAVAPMAEYQGANAKICVALGCDSIRAASLLIEVYQRTPGGWDEAAAIVIDEYHARQRWPVRVAAHSAPALPNRAARRNARKGKA